LVLAFFVRFLATLFRAAFFTPLLFFAIKSSFVDRPPLGVRPSHSPVPAARRTLEGRTP
jgi:hypothetical protein